MREPRRCTPILPYSARSHLCLIIALSGLLFLKNFPLFSAGQFVAEDAFFFYTTAYNENFLSAISTPYAGYLHVLPMLLAKLLWSLPFEILPWINHLTALILCVGLLSWAYTPSCRSLIRSDALRWALVVVLALTPHQPNLGMLLGLHWYLSFFVGLLFVCPLPNSRFPVVGLSVLCVLTAWSAPATIAIIPIALYRYWKARKEIARFLPLSFVVASLANALVTVLIFKPTSPQPDFADLSTALQATLHLAHQGVFFESLIGRGLASSMPPLMGVFLKWGLFLGLVFLIFKYRKDPRAPVAIVLIGSGMVILLLTMLRGFQSALIVESGSIVSPRYLTTPTFYIWTALFVLAAPSINRWLQGAPLVKASAGLALLSLCLFLVWQAPPLHGSGSLESAFPHREKARLLAQYESRWLQTGDSETLNLPGWRPIEALRLEVGGGRECLPSEADRLPCIFARAFEVDASGKGRVDWMPELTFNHLGWTEFPNRGPARILAYTHGYYWFRSKNGQLFVTGPAIFPETFNYPPEDSFHP